MPRTQDWSSILGTEEHEPRAGIPLNERMVIATPLDFSVHSIVEEVSKTPPRIYVDAFQRAYIWDNKKASRLIESLLLNIPIPVCYFSEEADSRLSIVDGNQRITSLKRFLNNEFALSDLESDDTLNGKRYHQLPLTMQNHIATRAIRCIVIDKRSNPVVKFDVFERLNTAAVALNGQELRNCLQRGRFNKELHELSKHVPWLQLMERRAPDKRMRDAELILRFLTLTFDLDHYTRPLKDFLTSYMTSNREADEQRQATFRNSFVNTVEAMGRLLGNGKAFHRLDEDGNPDGRFIAAIFDAQMVGFARAGATRKTPEQVLRFTIASTRENSDFMQRVVTGSSHVEALSWRINHYERFFRGN